MRNTKCFPNLWVSERVHGDSCGRRQLPWGQPPRIGWKDHITRFLPGRFVQGAVFVGLDFIERVDHSLRELEEPWPSTFAALALQGLGTDPPALSQLVFVKH